MRDDDWCIDRLTWWVVILLYCAMAWTLVLSIGGLVWRALQ